MKRVEICHHTKRQLAWACGFALLMMSSMGCGSSGPNVVSELTPAQQQVTLETGISEQSETIVVEGNQIQQQEDTFSSLFEASQSDQDGSLLSVEKSLAEGDYLAEGEYIELLGEQDFNVDRRFLGTLRVPGSLNGVLRSTDANNPFRNGAFNNVVNLPALTSGQRVQIDLSSIQFDTYLQLFEFRDGRSRLVAFNDDISRVNPNSRVVFTAQPRSGYQIRVTSFSPRATGAYTLSTRFLNTSTPRPVSPGSTTIGLQQVQVLSYDRSTGILRFRLSGVTGGCPPRILSARFSNTSSVIPVLEVRLTTTPPVGNLCFAAVSPYNREYSIRVNLIAGIIYNITAAVDNSTRFTLFSIQ
ncbi:MAG: hypothetical protein HC924_18560 [Synechococcaceae cyanobacterium SM2_3_2]|nr:hypothetical protein [Synechococcaceae cyanobacterium SM2_3_2]